MANEYLKRTPTSSGNRKVFTWSGWVKTTKESKSGNGNDIFFCASSNNAGTYHRTRIGKYVQGENDFGFNHYDGTNDNYASNADFRDFSSWSHYLCSVDTTKEVETDRVKIYVNGVHINDLQTVTASNQNLETFVNGLTVHYIGADGWETTPSNIAKLGMVDVFFVDGQALTPEIFGFYKDGKGYISAGSTQSTDFRNGQWVPRTPREIKNLINDNGGFGVNGFYLPMNDSSNPGADFHCEPNSIIKLKGEDLPQPRNGAPTTSDAFVSELRSDPFAANLVLAVPGISINKGPNLVANGDFSSSASGWTLGTATGTISAVNGELYIQYSSTNGTYVYQIIPTEVGKRYTYTVTSRTTTAGQPAKFSIGTTNNGIELATRRDNSTTTNQTFTGSFTATTTTTYISLGANFTANAYFDNVSVREESVPRDYSANIKGSGTNKTLTANGNAGVGHDVPSYYGSALSFDGSGDLLSLTNNTDFHLGSGDYTIECWINPDNFSGIYTIFALFENTPERAYNLELRTNGTPLWQWYETDGTNGANINPSVTLASGQWTHLAAERYGATTTLYVNGVAAGTNTTAPLGIYSNTTEPFTIGALRFNSAYVQQFPGKIQDLRFYKGVAKYKGGFDVPKPYTPVGIATWREVPDTCQNNFATWNPLDVYQNAGAGGPATLSGGNLITGSNDNKSTHSNFGVTSGKWYYESMFSQGTNNSDGLGVVAQYEKGYNGTSDGGYYILYRDNGGLFIGNGTSRYDPPAGTYRSWGPYDVISVGIDVDNREVIFFNKGVEELRYPFPSHVADGAVWMQAILNRQAGYIYTNFGQNPTFSGQTTAGTYTDSNGKGLFKYQPPSGFLALCEDNLPTPTIKDPGEYFKTVLYTGDDNSGRSITGVGFKPDLVWIKQRNSAENHQLQDSVRGATNRLFSNLTAVESPDTDSLLSFDSNGFSLGTSDNYNGLNGTYVAWCWKSGGETVTNTDGSITSQVSVNQDAGFSIVSYTGNATGGATVGHGLGKTPSLIILKSRSLTTDWIVQHKSAGTAPSKLILNSTGAVTNSAPEWNNTLPNSSTFTIGPSGYSVNNSGATYIAYCWTEIEGFSKFGSYVGNASADGSFIYCGFKPAFVITKRTDGTSSWLIHDSSRDPVNPVMGNLYANSSDVEGRGSVRVDFLSNGFKHRNADGGAANNYANDYIFMAFAESPFKTANAK